MRTGGYTFQQSLTSESLSIVKQAINIARRRGHAQVTPLHVASAMLSSSTGLLKRACLQSHTHPLQCKALELCFNVALNRLPTSVSTPILGPRSLLPSLSNALVAAFKRAQAHQRRGSIENQQQPILALKVEIEQLVISILDDPSISRVMREAGFSSTQVKNNVEQVVSSMEIITSTKPLVLGNTNTNMSPITSSTSHHVLNLSLGKTGQVIKNDDVMSVVGSMMNSKKKRNIVVIGECLATAEGVVRGVIDKFDKGEEVQGDMKHVQFISVPLFTLRNVSREEFEIKLRELRSLVKNYMNRGVVLYLGDLRWVSEFWTKYGEQQRNISYYSPVEHMIMELSRLLNSAMSENSRLWLLGIASFQTYTKCKTGHPSLQTLWDLYPLTIPVGSLGLSLNLTSDLHSHFRNKAAMDGSSWSLGRAAGVEKNLNCCADCLANFNKEAKTITSTQVKTEPTTYSSSSLPLWLQKYKEEHKQENNQKESEVMLDLCKKWNSICSSVHKQQQQSHFLEKGLISPLSSSPSPCSSNSISSSNDHIIKSSSTKLHKSLLNWPVIFEPNQSPKEHQFFISDQNEVTKPELLSNPNSSPNSASSSEASGYIENIDRFQEFNPENMKVLCKALEEKVPWQKDIIPDIVSTILECRSKKEESWLFFLGGDSEGKEKISRELAKIAFGSSDDHNFVSIGISSFSSSSSKSESNEHNQEVISNKKRSRNEHGRSYLERFADAIQENPNRVFFMEDIDQVDNFSQKGIKKSIENGRLTLSDGDLVSFKDAIIIFSSESLSSSVTKKCDDDDQVSKEKNQENIDAISAPSSSTLDLNVATHEESANGDENLMRIWEAVDKQVMFKIQVL